MPVIKPFLHSAPASHLSEIFNAVSPETHLTFRFLLGEQALGIRTYYDENTNIARMASFGYEVEISGQQRSLYGNAIL